MQTDELLTITETCRRAAFWASSWQRKKISPNELLLTGIREGLLSDRTDFHEAAGEKVIEIIRERELIKDVLDAYTVGIHHASLADIISSAIRKPSEDPWHLPEPTTLPNGHPWAGTAFLAPSGTVLRRIVLVSNWSNDKHFSFCRSWETIGNVCAYQMSLQMAVCVLGPTRDGRRLGYFSRGYRHPQSRQIRFRKRTDPSSGFKSSWATVFREDFDDIPTSEWLSSMHKDGVLADSCFSVQVDVPSREARQRVLDIAARRLDEIERLEKVPDENLTGCFWPTRCQFINPCHSGQSPNGKFGFVRVDEIG
jgi:hypothetical protein